VLLAAAIAAGTLLGAEAAARADGERPVATESGDGPFRIVDRPIKFDAEREQLTLAYRRAHSDPEAKDIEIEPRMIVLHYTAGGSAKGTINYFDSVHLEKGRKKLHSGGELNVSAHFVVDRDGTIYRLMPETRMARHCIGLNHIAIGIENVGDDKRWPLTEAQVKADAALVRYLAGRFPITHLIGHSEYRRMEGHPYFVERDPAYRNQKPDPGDAFLKSVRAEVADLKLSGPPDKTSRPARPN
jgi:N-acetylmuramoyl-L-alanine amidase